MPLDIQAILKQLQAAQDKANAANETRYQAALAEMETGRKKIAGQFDTARTEANIGATRAGATANQSLMSAGLGNTTIVQGAARGVEEDRMRALANIAGQQGAAEAGFSRDVAGLMASKNEQGPDLGLYAGLLAQASAAPTPMTRTNYVNTLGTARVAGGSSSAFSRGGSMFGGSSSGSSSPSYTNPADNWTVKGGGGITTPAPTPSTPAVAPQADAGGAGKMFINGQEVTEQSAAEMAAQRPQTPQGPTPQAAEAADNFNLMGEADWYGSGEWIKYIGASQAVKDKAKAAFMQRRAG